MKLARNVGHTVSNYSISESEAILKQKQLDQEQVLNDSMDLQMRSNIIGSRLCEILRLAYVTESVSEWVRQWMRERATYRDATHLKRHLKIGAAFSTNSAVSSRRERGHHQQVTSFARCDDYIVLWVTSCSIITHTHIHNLYTHLYPTSNKHTCTQTNMFTIKNIPTYLADVCNMYVRTGCPKNHVLPDDYEKWNWFNMKVHIKKSCLFISLSSFKISWPRI